MIKNGENREICHYKTIILVIKCNIDLLKSGDTVISVMVVAALVALNMGLLSIYLIKPHSERLRLPELQPWSAGD